METAMLKRIIRPALGRKLTIKGPVRVQGPVVLGDVTLEGTIEIPAHQVLVIEPR
jgi:hypothetical protein